MNYQEKKNLAAEKKRPVNSCDPLKIRLPVAKLQSQRNICKLKQGGNMKSNFTILIAEDDPNDVLLLRRAFKQNQINNPVHVVDDGEKAIDYLLRKPPYEDRTDFPYPDVILTDIKMPRKGGLELLQWVKENPMYRVTPTMVLTSSNDVQDIKQAFYLGASAYFVKPANFPDLVALIRRIHDFWCWSEIPT
jgi:CheY-like chemotaxis protein